MKTFFITLFLSVTGITVYAQQTSSVVIRGQAVDSLSQEAVPFAYVKIFGEQQKTVPVYVGSTDENGYFRLELKNAGTYSLSVEYLGKLTVVKPFSIKEGENLDFGKIAMADNPQQLQEVTVTAQRPLVKVDLDKITYSMEEDPESKTNNVLEMLKKVPMVTVDGEENIQVKGSSNFVFYINGKPSNMLSNNPKDVLRSIPANTVKNIEVITEPGAKYDAEGVAGIINIVMQSQSSLGGYTVSLNAYGNSVGQMGGGSYFSIKYGKVGLTGNLYYSRIRNPESRYSSFRENYANDDNRFLTQDGKNKNKGHFLMGYGEFSYETDTLNLINVNVSERGVSFTTDQFLDVLMKNSNEEDVYRYGQTSSVKNSQPGITLGADYQRTFSVKDRLLTASYKLDSYNNDQNSLSQINPVLNFNENQNRQFSNADSYEHTFQLDYTTPFSKIHSMEAGVKFIKRINKSRSGLSIFYDNAGWTDIPSDNDDFHHLQDIWAAYVGYNLKYKKWGLKTGVRYEGTRLHVNYPINTAQNFQADYSNVIPSITATYMAKQSQTFRVGYNLRIQRPGIYYLNPYINTTDSNYIQFGNPDLDVVKYHNFNCNYNLFTPKFTMNANLSYSFTNEGISDFTWIDGSVSKTSYYNLLKERRWNLSSYLNWTPTPKWRLFGNLSSTYSDLRSNRNSALHNSGFSGNFYGGAQYNLPRNFVLNLNGYGSMPNILLQGKTASYYYYSFSASKSFLDKRLNIRLNAANFFTENLKFTQTMQSDDFYRTSKTIRPFRQFGLSVSYRFGEMKAQIKKAQRTIQNEDQMQGGNSNSGGSSTGATPQ
ncbi:MAG: TonB-dependent receptor family protein [Candidatus Azobacteroides sp.]|nr:TonB-dependent receptor family protein [Candidatus Azobacteroides sp.]